MGRFKREMTNDEYLAGKGIYELDANGNPIRPKKRPGTNGTDGTDDSDRKRSQADRLIEIAADADLFHSPDGTAFADLDINGHRETWPVRSRGFRRWLARRFYEVAEGAANGEAMTAALGVVEARAHFDGPARNVHTRVGGTDGHLYLDLGDPSWRAVEIDSSGWRVVEAPPVRFRRAAGMQALPEPERGGSVEALRGFLNIASDDDFILVVAWLLAVLRDRGPYPALIVSGEQGSAKSTFSAIIRSLADPNTAPLRALPREDRDLFIAANNAHVLAFDNVSGLPGWISDTLCRLATGGGFAVRQLYSDQDEVLFDAARPAILNGIEDVVTRPDLADRAIFLTLDAIPEDQRRPEAEIWDRLAAERPRILGALLDAVATGLRRLPETRLDRLPRMADFALWIAAAETALWPAGTFIAAYDGNRDDALANVIDADPVASAVRSLMETRTVWAGTATDLLGALSGEPVERVARARSWPNSPRALSGRLRRASTFLRKTGIMVTSRRESGGDRTRIIEITRRDPDELGGFPSRPSRPSRPEENANAGSDLSGSGGGTVDGTVGTDDSEPSRGSSRHNPLKSNDSGRWDDRDARPALSSGPIEEGEL